nr:hypothetical protein KPHV_49790 [Kitasatospora purpeofusca]
MVAPAGPAPTTMTSAVLSTTLALRSTAVSDTVGTLLLGVDRPTGAGAAGLGRVYELRTALRPVPAGRRRA